MDISNVLRAIGRAALSVLLPWRVVRRDVDRLRRTAADHQKNVRYLRSLARNLGKRTSGDDRPTITTFDEVKRKHSAAQIADLKRRFLFQKRLALSSAMGVLIISACAIASGRLLGIATIIASMPLFFMACLSAQFRLWQLRNERLSKGEHGGLEDFFAENPRWLRQVLSPELGKRAGE